MHLLVNICILVFSLSPKTEPFSEEVFRKEKKQGEVKKYNRVFLHAKFCI